MLKKQNNKWHKTQVGQSLKSIASYYSVSERLLVARNRLTGEPYVGQMLEIPKETGHSYTVRAGDTKALLCGSEEAYFCRNGTDVFYIGMRIIL